MDDKSQGIIRDGKGQEQPAGWYRLAAEQGEPFTQTRLGYFYEKGLGVARDDKLAARNGTPSPRSQANWKVSRIWRPCIGMAGA
jgi:hypothetical protein